MGAIFLVMEGKGLAHYAWSDPWLVALASMRKQASEHHPPWPLHQLPGSTLVWASFSEGLWCGSVTICLALVPPQFAFGVSSQQ